MLIPVLGGIVVGLLMGALGGGGAILSIPLLVYGLGLPALEATTASLIIVGSGALSGVDAYFRQGKMRLKQGIIFGTLGLVGSFLANRLVGHIEEHLLMTLFSALLLVSALSMLRKAFRGSSQPPAGAPAPAETSTEPTKTPLLSLVLTASAVGFLTGFFGVGGGFIIVPALTMILGFGMAEAIGTSLVVIFINCLTASAFRFEHFLNLDWSLVAPFAVCSVVGTLLGTVVASFLKQSTLQISFAVFLLVIAVFIAQANIPFFLGGH